MEKIKRTYTLTKDNLKEIEVLQDELSKEYGFNFSRSGVINIAISSLRKNKAEIKELKKQLEQLEKSLEEANRINLKYL